MAYILYGSQTSPFVRRLRILLENVSYEFKELAVFEKGDGEILNKINPLNQVPVLTDGELTIWDSRQIFNYLNSIHRFQNFTWEDENLLTAIDGAMNSAVSLLVLKRSGLNITEDKLFFNRQHERINSIINYLTPYMTGPGLAEWNFHTISLYCFLDWAAYRSLISLEGRDDCIKFLDAHKNRAIAKSTKIPEGK